MLKKSSISILLALLMLISCIVVPSTTALAAADSTSTPQADNSANAYNLADNVQGGNILHAFNWHFTDVKNNMKEIAQAGFTSVQVSPVQDSKPTTNIATYACDWWALYQPINFSIGNSLGTKADFKEMCDTAEQYGVKIIVDIVANHMAQADSGIAGKKHPNVIEDLRLDDNCWHTVTGSTSDSSRYDMTQKRLSGIPDLNTSNEKVQSYVKSLLKECVDAGADGFRFDAAKHIELPSDKAVNGNEYASDFWPNITDYAKSIKPDVYLYGEILAPAGTDMENYTKYLNVTDSAYGSKVRSAIKSTTAGNLVSYGITSVTPDNLVTWIESHDNFTSGESNKLTHEQLLLGWGVIGARKDAPALYLVRPEHEKLGQSVGSLTIAYDELMGGPGNLLWQDNTVAEINKFRNSFVGQSEKVTADSSQFYVQRGDSGMVIVNLSDSAASVNYSTTMKDGTYTDYVGGTAFTVNGGVLKGTVAAKSVAVIYNKTKTTPLASVKLNGESISVSDALYFTEDTAKIDVELTDADKFAYSVDGSAYKEVSGNGSFTIGSGVSVKSEISITVKAIKDNTYTATTYKIVKKDPKENVTVYFDITGNESWIGSSGIYCYVKDENGNALAEYPGIKMNKVPGTSYYKATIQGYTKAIVKFNEGHVSTGLDGRTIPPTVVNYGTATVPANREAGGMEAVGTMIWQDNKWQNLLNPPVESVVTDCEPYALGDVDGNGKLSLFDVLSIQKHMAKINILNGDPLLAADIDANGEINSLDAMYLQKYFANISITYEIGYPVQKADATEYTIYFNNYKNWKDVYVYYWENGGGTMSSWPGDKLTEKVSDNVYKITLPVKANALILNNGNDGNDQSDEIIVTEEEYGKMLTCCKNTDGTYGIWTELNDFPEIPDTSVKVYFANTTNWKKVNVYMYKSGTGRNNGSWPGVAMTLEKEENGVEIYSINIEEGQFDTIIFNNGSSKSSDLPLESGNVLYTPQKTTGKFDCDITPYK